MQIITVSKGEPKQNYYCYKQFLSSLRMRGTEPIILEEGYQHLIDRPKMLLKFLKSKPQPKYTCFCDSWDLVWTTHPDAALERFQNFKTSILFNAERNLFPYDAELDRRIVDTMPSRYLNSGFMLGETEAIITLLDYIKVADIEDGVDMSEQGLFLWAFLEQPVPMKLDKRSEVAQCMFMEKREDFVLHPDSIHNKVYDTCPVVVHANGPAKTEGVFPIWRELWKQSKCLQ